MLLINLLVSLKSKYDNESVFQGKPLQNLVESERVALNVNVFWRIFRLIYEERLFYGV